MKTTVTCADWLTAACQTALDLATHALGCAGEIGDQVPPPFAALAGAYIPLSGDAGAAGAITVGLLAGETGCRALAGALLGVGDRATLSASDVADAVSEIVNMLAGGIKSRMLSRMPPIFLGLPMFLHGWIEPGERIEVAAQSVRIGRIDTVVLVLRQRPGVARST